MGGVFLQIIKGNKKKEYNDDDKDKPTYPTNLLACGNGKYPLKLFNTFIIIHHLFFLFGIYCFFYNNENMADWPRQWEMETLYMPSLSAKVFMRN